MAKPKLGMGVVSACMDCAQTLVMGLYGKEIRGHTVTGASIELRDKIPVMILVFDTPEGVEVEVTLRVEGGGFVEPCGFK